MCAGQRLRKADYRMLSVRLFVAQCKVRAGGGRFWPAYSFFTTPMLAMVPPFAMVGTLQM
jgi:hypothetical protein